MPHPLALRIEPGTAAYIQPLYRLTRIRRRRTLNQVVMIPKEIIRMHFHIEPPRHLRKQIQKMKAVRVIDEDHSPLDPTLHHVVPAPFKIHT